jgi:hypothetical protein
MTATAIPATSKPYSTALAPSSFRIKAFIWFIKVCIFCLLLFAAIAGADGLNGSHGDEQAIFYRAGSGVVSRQVQELTRDILHPLHLQNFSKR